MFPFFLFGGCCGKENDRGKNGLDFPSDEAWVIKSRIEDGSTSWCYFQGGGQFWWALEKTMTLASALLG